MNSSTEITKALPSDAFPIQEIFYRTWLTTYPNDAFGITCQDIEDRFKQAFTEDTLKKRSERMANPPKGETILVAKKEGINIAVCVLVESLDYNQLYAIYVLPEFQRTGIGKKLWKFGKKFLSPKKPTIVHVATYNHKAISFYNALGFKDFGKRFTNERFRMKSGNLVPEMEMVLATGF